MKLVRAVALRIGQIMAKNKIPSQYIVCKNGGLNESTLRNIINETCDSVNLKTLIKICDGLGISLQEFIDDELFKREGLDIE